MNIVLPAQVRFIIDTLENSGFEAYAVGGCIRDSFLGKEPKDWDICTSALPEQTMRVFDGQHIIETGLKYGTITLMSDHQPFEITTYRADRKYSDNRRPDSVKFVSVLKRDLARRDFTINAMAYSPRAGLADYYGGVRDLADKKIKCVGNPDKRFGEDALRIMRTLRFASTLGFEIEDGTSDGVRRNRELLRNIAAERISAELNKLLTGGGVGEILRGYTDVLSMIIPEIESMVGFRQNTPYHYLDVWEHTVTSIENAPPDPLLRLTMLLHDIAKPKCYTESDSRGHFHGHPHVSSDMAVKIMKRLKYSGEAVGTVSCLVLHHDEPIEPTQKSVRRWLSRIGEQRLLQLIEVKRADAMAQSERYRYEKLSALDRVPPIIDEIVREQLCFSLKDLAVSGKDLLDLGVPQGGLIGEILNKLLDMVISELVANEKEALLCFVAEFLEG